MADSSQKQRVGQDRPVQDELDALLAEVDQINESVAAQDPSAESPSPQSATPPAPDDADTPPPPADPTPPETQQNTESAPAPDPQDDLGVATSDHDAAETEIAETLKQIESQQTDAEHESPNTPSVPTPIRAALTVLVGLDYAFIWVPAFVKDILGYLGISTLILGVILWIVICVR